MGDVLVKKKNIVLFFRAHAPLHITHVSMYSLCAADEGLCLVPYVQRLSCIQSETGSQWWQSLPAATQCLISLIIVPVVFYVVLQQLTLSVFRTVSSFIIHMRGMQPI